MRRERKFKHSLWIALLMAAFLAAGPALAEEEQSVTDITKEVLSGPNDMNPEKILGPGGIGVETSTDLLMSFGATVRFIPTSESEWDFGLNNEVPGYFNTVPLKDYAGDVLRLTNAVEGIRIGAVTMDNVISNNRSDTAVISAYENFSNAYYTASSEAAGNPTLGLLVNGLAAGMAQIDAAVEAAETDAEKAAVIEQSVGTLIGTSDFLAATVAKTVTSNPDAVSTDIPGAISYLNILKAQADSFSPYYLASTFLRAHSNETGTVDDGYIRTETKMYFNAMPKDKKWSFYAALEFDRPIDTDTVDNRGGRGDAGSDFGMERLNASIEIVDGLRLHGGWDIWGVDVIEAASMVYGDDNAGFWLKGDYDPFDFSVAWLKLKENDFQNSALDLDTGSDGDRDLIAGYADYYFREKDKVRFFYGYDRIREIPSMDFTGYLANEAGLGGRAGIFGNGDVPGAEATSPDTDAHTIGGYYIGNFFDVIELMVEGAYKFGSADDTGLMGVSYPIYHGETFIEERTIGYNDFDISAYAFAADLAFELKETVGWHSLKPHIGFMYTSGDDDSTDDKLSGFTGITSGQRFSSAWGGENTIIGDSNMLLGTAIYGYIPELYGNGTPVFTGGVQNFAGVGNGRGDNPGLSMISLGITLRPKIFLIYRTNVNFFRWNEDFYVADMVNPLVYNESEMALEKGKYRLVEAGYVGAEWDNEVILALSQNMFVRGQFSFFFPGSAVEDATYALSGGTETDETISRLAAELIWNF